ncbi:putative TetR family transcriptional regulator [Gordonia effusa NBRC 100432]|uniref:Putative TetR family transcriptional regulator n=1 Tax=Gordonia effusa NBRC 100432 TaxID=1077974 RepID=H0R254_9ACTN|nr:TetR family transcriptional regulator [Gordonia effusa]GAB19159.1 putative TetR family transcriptional regulator [Gordonia effusa NBRC 100432]
MPHQPSRRELICDAALTLAATGGNHAVTHSAIDTQLGIAKGSTSYYFRTRAALIGAAIAYLTDTSRAAFTELIGTAPENITVDSAADFISDYLEGLLTSRRRDLLARYAFAPDAAADSALADLLARCVFAPDAAAALLKNLGASDPRSRAEDLLSLLEGLAFDFTYGSRGRATNATPKPAVHDAVRRWLVALTR